MKKLILAIAITILTCGVSSSTFANNHSTEVIAKVLKDDFKPVKLSKTINYI